jgi:hypothetical protein
VGVELGRSAPIEVEDRLEAIWDLYEEAERLGWSDGLPVMPASEARVEAAVAACGRPAGEVLGNLPPSMAPATVEKVAVCAVMAGCRPEYVPTVVAAVEAAADPRFELFSLNTTTNSVAPMVLVNGPVREEIGVNSQAGVLGPGFRANATIGRALSLVMINVAGRKPGVVTKSTQAQPGRYTFCIGEFEEANPWEPYHVENGFRPDQSVATVMAPTGTSDVIDYMSKSAEGLLTTIASSLTAVGSCNMAPFFGLGPMLLLLCPDHAALLHRAGWSKADVKRFLYEKTCLIPLSAWPEEIHEELIRSGRAVDGFTPLAARPGQFEIVVSGGRGGLHTVFLPTFGDSWPVSREIRRASAG